MNDVTDTETEEITSKWVEEYVRESMDWPLYFSSGEEVDEEGFVPAYYRVEGPNGPVSYVNPNSSRRWPTTMYDFAMEAQADDFQWKEREETPWPQFENGE